MSRVNLYLSPITAAYARAVAEEADAPNWMRPGLSQALTRLLYRLGSILRAAQPELSPAERRYVETALESLLPDVVTRDPDEIANANRLPSAERIAAEISDALPDLAEGGVRPDFPRWVASWTPVEVWAMVEAMSEHPIATAALEDSARPRVAGPGRPRKIVG